MIKCINLKNPEKFRMFPDHMANNTKFMKAHGWMVAPQINDKDSAQTDNRELAIEEPIKKRKYTSHKNKTTHGS